MCLNSEHLKYTWEEYTPTSRKSSECKEGKWERVGEFSHSIIFNFLTK